MQECVEAGKAWMSEKDDGSVNGTTNKADATYSDVNDTLTVSIKSGVTTVTDIVTAINTDEGTTFTASTLSTGTLKVSVPTKTFAGGVDEKVAQVTIGTTDGAVTVKGVAGHVSTGGAGGVEVSGGNGEGYLQSRSNGASFNSGSSGSNNAGDGGNSGSGGNGGDWGQDGDDGGNGVKGTDGNYTDAPDFGVTDGPTTGPTGGTAGASVSGQGYEIDISGVDSAYKGSK